MSDPDEYLDLLKKCLCGWLYDESAWVFVDNATIADKPLLLPPNMRIVFQKSFNAAEREIGKDWPLFGYTLIGLKRLDNIQFCIEQVLRNNVAGDLMEAGVWRGGAAMLMRAVLNWRGDSDRLVWLADSFEGMPKPTPQDLALDAHADHSAEAYLRVPLEQVQANFRRFGLLDERVRFLKGWFADSLPSAPIGALAVLRLDADLYESTHAALKHLYPRVSAGGYIIIDDYGDWAGCRKAVDDYRAERGIAAPLQIIDRNGVFWQVP